MTIFEYQDYRPFLRDHLKRLPSGGRGELTRIAGALAVNTTLLSQIMSGSRSFTPEQAYRLSRYLGFNELETDYLSLLVQIERAGTAELKSHLSKKLATTKQRALKLSERVEYERKLSEEDRAIFYSSWIYSAVHLFSSLKPEGVTLEEIAERFKIPRLRASEVMTFLTRTRLCAEQAGRFTMSVQSTFVEKGSPHLVKNHTNWRVRAIQKTETLTDQELMFTSQVSLSRADFEQIREKLTETIKGFLRTVKDSPSEDLACLHIDWFWME